MYCVYCTWIVIVHMHNYIVLCIRHEGLGPIVWWFNKHIHILFNGTKVLPNFNTLRTGVFCNSALYWAFNCFLDGNANKVDISIVGTNRKFFLINAHGVLRRMGAVTEIPGSSIIWVFLILSSKINVVKSRSLSRSHLDHCNLFV